MSFFTADRKPVDFNDSKVCYFLTPDQMNKIPPFDLGINIASFGEMTRSIVKDYVEMLKLKGFREFVSINQRLKKTNNQEAIGEKEYLEYFGPEYRVLKKASFYSNQPIMHLEEDVPQKQGYQLLHFCRAEA